MAKGLASNNWHSGSTGTACGPNWVLLRGYYDYALFTNAICYFVHSVYKMLYRDTICKGLRKAMFISCDIPAKTNAQIPLPCMQLNKQRNCVLSPDAPFC